MILISFCRSIGGSAASKPVQPPEPTIPKATSRSQLEAARTRFFAELMQSSDLFKDSPNEPLSLSSDSLNTDTAPPTTSTNNYTAKTTTNNNSLTSVTGLTKPYHTDTIANSAVGGESTA